MQYFWYGGPGLLNPLMVSSRFLSAIFASMGSAKFSHTNMKVTQ